MPFWLIFLNYFGCRFLAAVVAIAVTGNIVVLLMCNRLAPAAPSFYDSAAVVYDEAIEFLTLLMNWRQLFAIDDPTREPGMKPRF